MPITYFIFVPDSCYLGGWSGVSFRSPGRTGLVGATVVSKRSGLLWDVLHGVNRPGFGGGGDDTEGSLSWDRRGTPMSCGSELRGRALDALADPARVKGVIRRIGEELGVHPEALRTWGKRAQVDGGLRSGATTDQAQRIKELVKEVREL